MYWEAQMKDGSIQSELYGDTFDKIQRSKISSLTLKEDLNPPELVFMRDTGFLRFNSLKAQDEGQVPNLLLQYSKQKRGFIFDAKSREWLKANLIDAPKFGYQFGLLNGHDFQIDESPLKFTIKTSTGDFFEEAECIMRLPFYFCKAHADLTFGKKGLPVETKADAYIVGFNNMYLFRNLSIQIDFSLKFNLQKKQMFFEMVVGKGIFEDKCRLLIDFNGTQSEEMFPFLERDKTLVSHNLYKALQSSVLGGQK